MRTFGFVLLAACWSSSKKPAADASPPIAQPVIEAAPAAPAIAGKRSPYVMPARVRNALAAEKLAGNVLVPYGASLHASLPAARSDANPTLGRSAAMQVVADHGDVVELSTAPVTDCVESWDQPYQLRVFVARAKLAVRTKADVTKTFADGTAIAIDRGAPIELTDNGPVWGDIGLGTAIQPAEDQFVLAVPPLVKPAALPPAQGDRLVCDGAPMTFAEWRAHRQQVREAEARAERARRDEERARLQAERDAKRKAEAAKPKPRKGSGGMDAEDAARFAELLVGESEVGDPVSLAGRDEDRFPKWCGVFDPAQTSFNKPAITAAPPKIDGRPVPWPAYDRRSNEYVTRVNGKLLADIGATCGRLRMSVAPEGVRWSAGGAGVGGGSQIKVWVPAPGPVTWRDGSPAGTYAGTKRYKTFVEEATRICVRVPGVADMLCHDRKKAKTEMRSPWRAD